MLILKINCIKSRVTALILLTLALVFFAGNSVLASETTSAEKGIIRGDNVEIHAETSSGSVVDGPVIDTLNAGFEVIILETRYSSRNADRNKWYEILYTKNNERKTGWVRYDFVDTSGRGLVAKGQVRYTDMDDVPIYADASNIPGSLVCRLDASYAVTVKEDGVTTGSDQHTYYHVTFTPPKNYGNVSEGFVRFDHLIEKDPFQTDLEKEGFPEDYAQVLQKVHELYPNWKFTPVYVGESSRQAYNWDDVLAAECKTDVNQHYSQTAAAGLFAKLKRFGLTLEANMLIEKAEKDGTDTLVEDVTGAGWVSAPKDLIAYYLDPRNFISPDAVNDGTIFQFESLRREEFQTKTGVKKILEGTFMSEKTVEEGKMYADIFMEAGETYGVSPYHLAARVRQEQGVDGTSPLISGKYSGYEGYYNYYNVGAYGNNETEVWENGLEYAKDSDENTLRPWNTRYKALMGGSKFVASKYAKCNDYTPARRYSQDTLYFQKFNVKKNNGKVEASHQYMQNVAAPSSEAKLLKRAHPTSDLKEEELVFKIPVYANMPAQPCPKP